MLSGVKFISREEIGKGKSEKKSGGSRKEKHRRKKSSGSSDEDQRIEKVKGKRNKWYSSEEYSSDSESESGSEDSLDRNKKKRQSGKKKKSKSSRKHYSSDDSSDDDSRKERSRKGSKKGRRKKDATGSDMSDDDQGDDMTIKRKEMGLDWMLRPKEPTHTDSKPASMVIEDKPEEALTEEIKKPNPRELNPYFKDNGSGYPEEAGEARTDGKDRIAPSVIGDGGASWRLKALKRAQEQAAREGRKLNEVVEERWGSVGQLAVSAASRSAAPSRAHLHAIRSRQKDVDKKSDKDIEKNTGRDYLKDVSLRPRDMKAPKVHNNLSWGKRKLPSKEAGVISAAMATLNKFSNDGSFLHELQKQSDGADNVGHTNSEDKLDSGLISLESDKPIEENAFVKEGLSANQLAAKALQLRMKGKLEEAEKLMQEADRIKAMQQENSIRPRNEGSTSRLLMKDMSSREKKKEDDADVHLARKIMQNKQYSMLGRADDEYDFEDGPSKKSRKKGGGDDRKVSQRSSLATHILTQQERCLFCFENPKRPKHLVVSIANFTYLMLPQWQSVVPGHCCILTTQHESSTRTVDNNVWDEIRNFKKCLIMMFAKQDKELIFLETVMGLAQQRCHCMVECIPLPQDIAKEAPLYFKKAIDEAEDEWSQHNAKKLIDTSVKGLRGSIPKDFPYFHVEFGLSKGFVHVIDDEQQFKSNLGLNVIRGMLELAEEDMYRRRRHESMETQKLAVSSFVRDWEPFDWTKQLE